MFRESLIETSHASVVQRGWATLMSFGLELAFVSLVVLTPLFLRQAVPAFQTVPTPPAFTRLTVDQIRNAIGVYTSSGGGNSSDANVLRAPGRIPPVIDLGGPSRPSGLGRGGNVAGACAANDCIYDPTAPMTSGDSGSVLSKIVGVGTYRPVLDPVGTQSKVVRRSHMDPGMLIARIEPNYPEIAKIARVQGEVVLTALIDRDGRIVNLHATRGHYMLVKPALDAVSQWRYRPTFLNGQPVEVETQIVVNFKLQ